jgi:hypothetical protein
MHLLGKPLRVTYFIALLTFVSCVSHGALTPEDAFYGLQKAYRKGDARAVLGLLSRDGIASVKAVTSAFAGMDDRRLGAVGRHMGAAPEVLRKCTPEGYIALQMKAGKALGSDSLYEATKYRIVGTDIRDGRAVIRVKNGMEVPFVKEGPYWKLDTRNW